MNSRLPIALKQTHMLVGREDPMTESLPQTFLSSDLKAFFLYTKAMQLASLKKIASVRARYTLRPPSKATGSNF